jgi:NAD(P)-dependent dehydrogenase (short-subunit alcohol dehydrogenase family)
MKQKIALITGASRGLGRALAEVLQKEGYLVYSGVRDITQFHEGTIPIALDLLNERSLTHCVETIIKERGAIDLLIHNAGIAYWGAVDSMTLAEAQNLFAVNFFAPFRLTQLFLPHMRKKREGKIIFVSSIRAVESCAYMGMYSASKAALEAIALDWAASLQPWNISVHVVQPGPMATGIDIRHGNYFPEGQNPYLPYGDVSIEWQPVFEACKAILEQIQNPNCPYRFQTSEASRELVAKHVIDPSGMKWYQEQKAWVLSEKILN